MSLDSSDKPSLQFLVFGGDSFYEPAGGMRDFIRSFSVESVAVAYAEGYITGKGSTSWTRVYDWHEQKEVYNETGS